MPSLEVLRSLLTTASSILDRLPDDPLMRRWVEVFEAMPEQDREAVLAIVERDVAFRRHSLGGDDGLLAFRTTGPNPNARLYMRVYGQDDTPFLPFDELVHATIYGARLTHRSLTANPPAAPDWRDAQLAAFSALTSEELDSAIFTCRLVLELAEQVRGKARDRDGG